MFAAEFISVNVCPDFSACPRQELSQCCRNRINSDSLLSRSAHNRFSIS